MGENKTKPVNTGEEKKEPSYEQLKNWCNQLMMQRNQVAEKLTQVTDVINKLPWLFKVIEHRDAFDYDFVDMCAKEIVVIMTPATEEESKEEPKE